MLELVQTEDNHTPQNTVGCAAWGVGEWLGVVQRVLLARWHLGASSRGVVWGCTHSISGGCRCAVRAAMPVAMPARLVHPAPHYGASGLSLVASTHGCVLCWGDAGRAVPVAVCCVSCFVHVCRYLQCGCSVVPTCLQASFVLLLPPIVLHAWCYVVLLHSM